MTTTSKYGFGPYSKSYNSNMPTYGFVLSGVAITANPKLSKKDLEEIKEEIKEELKGKIKIIDIKFLDGRLGGFQFKNLENDETVKLSEDFIGEFVGLFGVTEFCDRIKRYLSTEESVERRL